MTTRKFSFFISGIALVAPVSWEKGPFVKRLLYPFQPELYGPANQYLGFDNIISKEKAPESKEAAQYLRNLVLSRGGNRIADISSLEFGNQSWPAIVFDKSIGSHSPIRLKKYYLVVHEKICIVTVRLSHGGTIFYAENDYDEIVKTIRSRKW